jgi:hypothetical protein
MHIKPDETRNPDKPQQDYRPHLGLFCAVRRLSVMVAGLCRPDDTEAPAIDEARMSSFLTVGSWVKQRVRSGQFTKVSEESLGSLTRSLFEKTQQCSEDLQKFSN